MCMGLVFFTLADVSVSPNFDFYGSESSDHIFLSILVLPLDASSSVTGVALVSSALLADAVIGNVQERTMREYGSRNVEVKFTRICTNSSNFD